MKQSYQNWGWPWATVRQIYQNGGCSERLWGNLSELRLLWASVRQSYQNWGCSEHLWDNLTNTEVDLSNCDTHWPELRLLWTAVRQSYQYWGCSEHLWDNLTRIGGCSEHLWGKFTAGCSEHLWDNLSRSETILPELRLLWAAVRPSSLSPVSFMLFWRLADRVRARASRTVLNKISLSWHCLKYVYKNIKSKGTNEHTPYVEHVSDTYSRTTSILDNARFRRFVPSPKKSFEAIAILITELRPSWG